MRLAMLRVGDRTVLAARRRDGWVDLSQVPGGAGELGALLRAAPDFAALQAVADAAPAAALVAGEARYAPPIATGAKVLCLGLNFLDHANEGSYAKPEYPVVFSRYPASFVGHGESLELPAASSKFDYEAELVVVIGKRGRHISREAALAHVAGYTLMNDGSVRDFQKRTPQWLMGKNFDRSGALGPEIVTADELPPGARELALRGRLNGTVMQQASTSDMLFDVATTIAYITIAMTLEPGDLIALGTPAGVGHARNPPVFMTAGDTYEIELERVGTLRNSVRPETT